jgi:hypothetical protein
VRFSCATYSYHNFKEIPFYLQQVQHLSTQTGNTYQWFKDGVAISGATSQQYQTSTAGQYSVKVDFGSCSSTPTITLEDVPFTSSLNVSATTIINEAKQNLSLLLTRLILFLNGIETVL